MPYNTAAIVQSEESTGTTNLPLSRVKKTIAADEDIGAVSAQATFVIAKATELFIQYAAEKAHDMARAEAKPKRSLTYTHVANAVARTDNLEFLSDIVPQTTTMRAHLEKKAREAAVAAEAAARKAKIPLDPRQATLDGHAGPSTGSPAELSLQSRSLLTVEADEPAPDRPPATMNGSGPNGDERLPYHHHEPRSEEPRTDAQGDVQMS